MLSPEEEHRLTVVEDRSTDNALHIKEMDKRLANQEKLIASVNILATKLEHVDSDVKEIKKEVKEINGKPAKRWEGLVEKIFYTVVGAVVLFILAKFGL